MPREKKIRTLKDKLAHNFLSQLQFFKVGEIMADEKRAFDSTRGIPDKANSAIDFKNMFLL